MWYVVYLGALARGMSSYERASRFKVVEWCCLTKPELMFWFVVRRVHRSYRRRRRQPFCGLV